MLPLDPHLGMRIVNQYRKEAEGRATAYRMFHDSGQRRSGWVAQLSRSGVARAGGWFSALGSWLEEQGVAGGLPLDGQARPSA